MKIFEEETTTREFYLPLINAKMYAQRFAKETLPILKRSNSPAATEKIAVFKDFAEKIKKFLVWRKEQLAAQSKTADFFGIGKNKTISTTSSTDAAIEYKLSDLKDVSVDMIPYYDEKEIKDMVDKLAEADETVKGIKATSSGYKPDKEGMIKKDDFSAFLYSNNDFFKDIFKAAGNVR
jgi:hypothetical protein